MKKKFLLFILILFSIFSAFSFSSAAEISNFSLNGNTFLNLAINNTINITIGAVAGNISNITFFYLTDVSQNNPDLFIAGSNITTATGFNFINSSSGSPTLRVIATFLNTSASGFINNGTTQTFSIDVVARRVFFTPGALLSLVVTSTSIYGTSNTTTYNFQPAFAFSGFILNETGCSDCWQNNTNVTIYGVINNNNGPPTNLALASTLTNASGYFILSKVNGSNSFSGYQLKTLWYNSSGTATKVGSIMPTFPSMMFYGGGDGGGFDMSLNGGTFYLQPATTINLWATNGTTMASFGYELIDQALGFPVESNVLSKINTTAVVVPANRGYTVSFFRMFGFPGSSTGYINDQIACASTADFMNDTTCPAPPKTFSINATTASSGAVITINQSLIIRKVDVRGCINPTQNSNNSNINITFLNLKMVPWTTSTGSFVPPRSGNDGSINLTTNINYSYPGCFAYYNISLLNQTNYMLEFYAKNASTESGNPGSANNLAGFQNLTTIDNLQVNITLFKLAGSYYTSADSSSISVNTSYLKFNIINSTGGSVTTSVNANFKIKNNGGSGKANIGTVYYIVDDSTITNGTFYFPILNNSNFAKIMIFSQNGPPRENSINLSANEFNITIVSMGMDKGFKKLDANGSLGSVDTSSMPIQMRFLRTSPTICNLPNAPESCVITAMNASSFNPLKAMLAGKVNMEIKVTATNVSLIFHDYDMMSAKQPPMDSVLDQNASGRSNNGGKVQDTWNFGSFAPSDSYSNVTIVLPYSDTSSVSNYLNDSNVINFSVPILYDENQKVNWNSSSGDTVNTLGEDFLAYNDTYYNGFLNIGGALCSNTSQSAACFVNYTSNFLSVQIPHFSTIGASVLGSGVVTTIATSTTTTSGGGGNINIILPYWTNSFTISESQFNKGYNQVMGVKNKINFVIGEETHILGIVGLTNNNVTINVSSIPQQAVFNVGDIKKFEVTGDNYYDLSVKLNSISESKANITMAAIHDLVPFINSDDGKLADIPEQIKKFVNQTSDFVWIIVIVLIIVLLIIILFYLLRRRKAFHYKNKNKSYGFYV
jgi:hypothetical protein